MIQLLIKAGTESEVRELLQRRCLWSLKTVPVGNGREMIAWVDDQCWLAVTTWFAEPPVNPTPGLGFPFGTLLHFTYGAVVPNY